MGELDDVLSWIAGIESDDNTDLDDDGLKRWLAQHIVARDAAIRAEAKREERARIATDGYVPASERDAYKAKAEEWERQVGEITDRLMTIVDDEIGVVPTAGPHDSMDRIVAGLRAFRAEAEEWQARAEALAGVLREIAKPVDCPADEVALWDELSAKAALNAYDAANTSEGSGEALPPPPAKGSSPKAPEPLRDSLPSIVNAVKRDVAEALRIVVREHDGKRTTMAQALRELADLLCPST